MGDSLHIALRKQLDEFLKFMCEWHKRHDSNECEYQVQSMPLGKITIVAVCKTKTYDFHLGNLLDDLHQHLLKQFPLFTFDVLQLSSDTQRAIVAKRGVVR
jgi:hypothetical protein